MKKGFLLLALLMPIFFVWVFAQVEKEDADRIITDYIRLELDSDYLLYAYSDTLSGQVSFFTWEDTLQANNAYAYFIDEAPQANWSHPCRYVFVDKGTGHLNVVNADTPPKDAYQWSLLSRKISTQSSGEFFNFSEAKLPRQNAVTMPENSYAVIISGGGNLNSNHIRYWNDCSAIYSALINVYGYLEDHIYVIMSDGTDPAADRYDYMEDSYDSSPLDLDGNGTPDIQYAATKANITAVFNELSGKLSSDDDLFIFTTDHGGSGSNGVYLVLWNSVLFYPSEFAAELEKVNAGNISIVMEQCNSGGFVPYLAKESRVVATACSATESSWAMSNGYYDEFAYHWTSAIAGVKPDGGVVDADTNDDGFVSMQEAFSYAVLHDAKNETPQYNSIDSHLGNYLTLSGIEGCVTSMFDNQTVSADKEVLGCSIESTNVVVEGGTKLTLNHLTSTTINGPFETKTGAELEIR